MRGELQRRMDLLAQEKEKRKRLAALRRDTLRKTEFLRKKSVIDAHEVYGLIKGFFRDFLERQEEFTVAELREALKEVYVPNATRQAVGLILEKLHKIEYLDVAYGHGELVALLETFSEAVQQLVKTHTRRPSLLTKMRAFLFKEELEPEVVIADLPVVESDDPARVRILTLIEQCYAALDKHRMSKARSCYAALLDSYAALPEPQKREFYPLLDQAYRDLKNRR